MAIANQIAQFGMNAGRDIQGTVRNAMARSEDQRRYGQQQERLSQQDELQNKMMQTQAQALADEKERKYAANAFEIMSRLPPDARPAAWQQFIATGSQQGIDMAGVPTQYDDSLLQKLAFQGGGENRSSIPADIASFNALSQNLTPEEQELARRIELGLNPRAGTVSSTERIGVDPSLTDQVAGSQATIAGAKESAKLGAQLETKPEIAAATKSAEIEVETAANKPKARAKLESMMRKTDRVIDTIDDAAESVDWQTAGFAGSIASAVKGTPAYDLKQNVITIKANLGFDALQEMRDNSPTGGALGQVAIQELEALQASVRSLDLGQSPAQLASNLKVVREHYRNYKNAVQASYNAQYESGDGPREITTQAEYDALPSGSMFMEDGRQYRKP